MPTIAKRLFVGVPGVFPSFSRRIDLFPKPESDFCREKRRGNTPGTPTNKRFAIVGTFATLPSIINLQIEKSCRNCYWQTQLLVKHNDIGAEAE